MKNLLQLINPALSAEYIEDLKDTLREEGCPEDEIDETALMIIAENQSGDSMDSLEDADDPNPFWETSDSAYFDDLETELAMAAWPNINPMSGILRYDMY